MKSPRSKYDYPGLPLWDRDGNPVGVGDLLDDPTGNMSQSRIYYIGNRPVEWGVGDHSISDCPKRYQIMRLVMPPGFPKDRRVSAEGETFRFVDDRHGYWLTGHNKGQAFTDEWGPDHAGIWTHDGDGNPVTDDTLTGEHSPDTLETLRRDMDRLRDHVIGLQTHAEADEIRRRLDELSRTVEGVKTQVGRHQGWIDASIPESFKEGMAAYKAGRTVDLETALTEPPPAPLPADPDDWDLCETDSSQPIPGYYRCATAIVYFTGPKRGRVVASRGGLPVGHFKEDWVVCLDPSVWTPVRPRRREVERRTPPQRGAGIEMHTLRRRVQNQRKQIRDLERKIERIQLTPDPDRELRDWFWANRERITFIRLLAGRYSLVLNSMPRVGAVGDNITEALRSLREQVEAAERSGQEKGGAE